MFIATVVAAPDSPAYWLAEALELLDAAGAGPGAVEWLDADRAADVALADWLPDWRAGLLTARTCDVVVQAAADRRRRLIVSDMDSTVITVECIDELADYAGCRAEVAEVTERAMRGELDFAASLRERVALLAGLPAEVVDECLRERVQLMEGAATLMATARCLGLRTVLVSGGFTRFADPVAARLGYDRARANVLVERDGRLSGAVSTPVFDADAKKAAMIQAQRDWSITPAQTLAVGDGANDLPILRAAGLGVAYRAKPLVQREADGAVRHGDLTALLSVLGVPRSRWVVPGE